MIPICASNARPVKSFVGPWLSSFQPASDSNDPLEAMRAAARDLDEMIASWGATEDQLMDEYKTIQRSARQKRRNAQ
jgi:hypothetical protein